MMGTLDDTAIFATVIQQGSFNKAAKVLGLSNGMISRRISQLETSLGVTLIRRTTRQLQLTEEGNVLWEHAKRINQELEEAVSLIQCCTQRPTGFIKVSTSLTFGRRYLSPLIMKFLSNFPHIQIELILTNQLLDPIKEHIDICIRGYGYLKNHYASDNNLKMRTLVKRKISLVASPEYLAKHGEPQTPEDLNKHMIIGFSDQIHLPKEENWSYEYKGQNKNIIVHPRFSCNDVETSFDACIAGNGIAKIGELVTAESIEKQQLKCVLPQYDWGQLELVALYPAQVLPKRTRLLLDFIIASTKHLNNTEPEQELKIAAIG